MERRPAWNGHAYSLGEFVDYFGLENGAAQPAQADSGAAHPAANSLQLLSDPVATTASWPDAAQPAANSLLTLTSRAQEFLQMHACAVSQPDDEPLTRSERECCHTPSDLSADALGLERESRLATGS